MPSRRKQRPEKPLARYDRRRRRYPARRKAEPVDLSRPIEYSDGYRYWVQDMLSDIRPERKHEQGIRGFDTGIA